VRVGSMRMLLSWRCWEACQEGVCLDPHFYSKRTSPRLAVDLPLAELAQRNPHIQKRFRRIDANSFTAAVYADGRRAAQCTIWMGGRNAFSSGIVYSNQENAPGGSFNETLNLMDDGYTLSLKPLGMPLRSQRRNESLSQQGAAEYYWSLFIEPLQR
jgi:hypothetical protein